MPFEVSESTNKLPSVQQPASLLPANLKVQNRVSSTSFPLHPTIQQTLFPDHGSFPMAILSYQASSSFPWNFPVHFSKNSQHCPFAELRCLFSDFFLNLQRISYKYRGISRKEDQGY